MLLLADLDRVIHDVMHNPLSIPLSAIILTFAAMMVCGIGCSVTKVLLGRGRERTCRELAAYVAEGTLHPDQAVAMLNAGQSRPTSADLNVPA